MFSMNVNSLSARQMKKNKTICTLYNEISRCYLWLESKREKSHSFCCTILTGRQVQNGHTVRFQCGHGFSSETIMGWCRMNFRGAWQTEPAVTLRERWNCATEIAAYLFLYPQLSVELNQSVEKQLRTKNDAKQSKRRKFREKLQSHKTS